MKMDGQGSPYENRELRGSFLLAALLLVFALMGLFGSKHGGENDKFRIYFWNRQTKSAQHAFTIKTSKTSLNDD